MSPRSNTPTAALGALALLIVLPAVQADICYTTFGRRYECGDRGSGLSTAARWGIGAGIAAAIIALAMLVSYYRRKRIMSAWKKHTQNQQHEGLPYHSQDTSNTTGYYNNNTTTTTQYPQTTGQYAPPPGAPPVKQPQAAYTPSMAGAYGSNGGTYSYGQNNTSTTNDAGPDYEYRQAEENRLREEAEAGQGAGNNEPAPPGYDVVTRPAETGTQGQTYQPPAGPPPGKGARDATGGTV